MATHLPGKDNTLVDAISRGTLSLHELRVDPAALVPVFDWWGTPSINFFASANNKQCHLFCSSRSLDPRSFGDGIFLDWTGKFLYMFPPISLIPQVLKVPEGVATVHVSDSIVAEANMVPHFIPVVLKQVPVCQGDSSPMQPPPRLLEPETHCMATGLTFSERVNTVLLNARKPSA